MINVENDYEPIIYQKPIYSHIYQNHDHFFSNFFIRSVSNNTTKEKIEKIVEEIKEEKPTECSSTNNLHQNIPKETHLQTKYMDKSTSSRKSKIKTTANTRP